MSAKRRHLPSICLLDKRREKGQICQAYFGRKTPWKESHAFFHFSFIFPGEIGHWLRSAKVRFLARITWKCGITVSTHENHLFCDFVGEDRANFKKSKQTDGPRHPNAILNATSGFAFYRSSRRDYESLDNACPGKTDNLHS